MITGADEFKSKWETRLGNDYPAMTIATQQSIIQWLLGDLPTRFSQLSLIELQIQEKAINYRYKILQQGYLNVNPKMAYDRLLKRLGFLSLLTNKIRGWVASSQAHQQTVADVITELIHEMLQRDRYLLSQLNWISQCTPNNNLRNSLLLASLEEYCLRPIRNQPLIAHRFVNFLQSQNRGGITHVPRQELVRIISEEITREDDSLVSLTDNQALESYQELEKWEQVKALRLLVQQELADYLAQEIGTVAVNWLNLYLQGLSPEIISQSLNLSPKQTYRLREKITYHALQVFALKMQPELVQQWLEISLLEHNLGLTSRQWQVYLQNLNQEQIQLISQLKTGKTLEEVCREFKWTKTQGLKKWRELYFLAQKLRNCDLNIIDDIK
ncbi:HetZ-related protein 2 [Gloeocapsa sp. PCC 73106]|uniref:HetZ-related protein 2 n=1 Tax=Gloeocapsa sp. PCC 73106 TaxID=102232 RepID=UPI0002AC17D7|nr:HetZ-related protein 2 [Gloeocapsa sp. PCC 73106]ELR99111.1 hypothetical protein GLO73106DRAFT_00029590 [Gloeocapsa sp. PCC 73106]